MKSLLLALTAIAAFGLFDQNEARAQAPRNTHRNNAALPNNPLMPNLGVPYTNMQMARSMLSRGNRGRNRRRAVNSHSLMNNLYRNPGPSVPF